VNILWPKKGNIRKYTTFCVGINEDGDRKSKKNNYICLLTKYIKSVLWGVAVHYGKLFWFGKINFWLKQLYFRMLHVIMLFYISLPRWPITNTLCNTVDRERFLSLEQVARSRSVATYGISGYAHPSLQKTGLRKCAAFPVMHLQYFGMSVRLVLVTHSSAR